jgi:CRISPR/Cas system Type II protein with McrA/HNH and RuvC-like nuclease domain
MHKVCYICYKNTNLCPYCRSLKNQKLNYWLYDKDKKWYQLTDDLFKYGIDDNFNYINYLDRLLNIITEILIILNNYKLEKSEIYAIIYSINKLNN